jgi:tripartite-type tricarboxylate transporter receptor subunit TctC
VKLLNQAIVGVLNQSDVKERFLNVGMETVGSTPAEFAATIKADTTRLAKVIREAGIRE